MTQQIKNQTQALTQLKDCLCSHMFWLHAASTRTVISHPQHHTARKPCCQQVIDSDCSWFSVMVTSALLQQLCKPYFITLLHMAYSRCNICTQSRQNTGQGKKWLPIFPVSVLLKYMQYCIITYNGCFWFKAAAGRFEEIGRLREE